MDFQPTVTVALSDDCRLQARIDVVTRTNSYQVRTGDYSDDVISVYLILRRYWGDRPKQPMTQLLTRWPSARTSLCTSYIVPRVLKPISSRDRVAVVMRLGYKSATQRELWSAFEMARDAGRRRACAV